MKTKSLFTLGFVILNSLMLSAHAQGTAFTYQGRLNASGAPANGTYDLVFTIYDLPTGSGAFANQTNSATPVSNGLFTVTLNFGPGIFTGPERWLEIAARTNGVGAFTSLAPRQKITATPYAITAGNVTGSVLASQLSGSIAPANIGAGTITSTMLAAGSVTTGNLADGAVSLAKLNTASAWTSSTIFTNPTPAVADTFGGAMAAVGPDKVLISAAWDDPGVSGAGAAYLFSTSGSLLMSFTNPAPAQEDLFGVAMDAVGPDKVLIGAYRKDIGATDAGAAYLYSTNGTLLTTFTNPTPAVGDEFGSAVAAVGTNKVLIGAPNDSTGVTNAGAAYLFNLNGTLLSTFTNPAPAASELFGYQVLSVGTDKVLISAPLDGSFGPNAGAAYLYSTNGTLLTTVSNPSPGQIAFGIRMAPVGNDKFVITGALDPTNGVVYLFNTNGTRLATFGPALGLGTSLAWVSPDKVAIGVPGGPGGASFVYLFNTNGTQLATFTNPTQNNSDLFGYTLTAVGDRVVVGAPQNDTGAAGSGLAYLFGANGAYVPGLISQGVLDGSITAASLANVAIDSSKIADGTISTVDLADGSVTDDKIADVDASKITTGILADARLSLNVALLNANQLFTGQNTLNNAANVFAGDGSGLTSLNSSQLTSGTLPDARLSANIPRLSANQTFTGQNTLNNPANSFSGNGGGLTNVNALTLGGISSNGFWRTTGNAGTTPGTHFVGTTDNQPLRVKVNNVTAVQFAPGVTLPNVVGGLGAFIPSVIGANVSGAVIAGGAAPAGPVSGLGGGDFHAVYDSDGTVGGGFGNKVGSNNGNPDDAPFATVAGGVFNGAAGYASTVAGGDGNLAGGARSAVLGGAGNLALGLDSAVGGGAGNRAESHHASTGGGQNNVANNAHSAVAGGGWNTASGVSSFIGGGGGDTFGGPWTNMASGNWSAILGGWNNTASGYSSVVGGGGNNMASGQYSVVPGGDQNRATASYCFAAGRLANALHDGSFVWADTSGGTFASTANNQFLIRASGGVGIGTANPASALHVIGTVTATAFNPPSDRNLKENFALVSAREVLDKVTALPISRWNFKGDAATLHVGPMAQDFHAAFGLGTDDKHIATVDADGVALAAIQGLNQKIEAGDQKSETRILKLEAENGELKRRLEKLERLLETKLIGSAR